MQYFCVDTNILIYGHQKRVLDGHEILADNAERFIDWADEASGVQIAIPTIVLTEYLKYFDQERRADIMDEFQRRFIILAYDAPASEKAVIVWRENYDEEVIQDLTRNGVDKDWVDADCMIIGTALRYGAECIVSNDDNTLKDLADGFIEIGSISPDEQNATLFGDIDFEAVYGM